MFDIGAKVVCVNDKFGPGINDIYNALPRKGSMYTVRDLVPGQTDDFKPTVTLLLEELVNKPNLHGIEPGFRCDRFRAPDEVPAKEAEERELEPAIGTFTGPDQPFKSPQPWQP